MVPCATLFKRFNQSAVACATKNKQQQQRHKMSTVFELLGFGFASWVADAAAAAAAAL